MSIAALRSDIAKLDELAVSLSALATQADEQGVETLRIDGITKLSRGLELVRDFTANATQSLIKAKLK